MKISIVKRLQTTALLALFIILQACGGNSESKDASKSQDKSTNKGTSVETISVSKADISKQIRAFGTVQAEDVVKITPQVSNRVTHIYADLGDTVRQGTPLAKIYDASFSDAYEQAKAQLAQSKAAFERDSLQFSRQKKLHEQGLISSTEFDDARATFQNSKAQLQSSKANLTQSKEDVNNSVIRSPVFGVVLTRNIAKGDLASSGQVAFEVANLTGYETRVYLPLTDWMETKVGQPVTFRVSNQKDISAKGRVSRISPRLDPVTGLGEVVISLTQKGNQIYQGVLVEASINVETHKQAVVIPRSALVENVQTLIEPESNTIKLDRTYSAFVVKNDTLAIKKDAKLGIEQGDHIEITEGLNPEDQIVITGQNSLEDSSKVHIAESNPFQESGKVPFNLNNNDSLSTPTPSEKSSSQKETP